MPLSPDVVENDIDNMDAQFSSVKQKETDWVAQSNPIANIEGWVELIKDIIKIKGQVSKITD